MSRQKRQTIKKNRFWMWIALGVLLGSFIPDNFSPLVLIKKIKS